MTLGFEETRQLLVRARAGDTSAIGELLVRHREPLLGRIRLMMGAAARAVAESGDFLHDVFVELARGGAWQRCADQNSFLRHCTAIARNNVRDSVRRKREQRLHDFTCSTLRLVGADGKTPSELAEHREQTERVVDALAELAPLDREVIELRDFERLAYVDIGLRIGRSENATQLLHARALRRLSKLLCRA